MGFSFADPVELVVTVTPEGAETPLVQVQGVAYVITGTPLSGAAHIVFQTGYLPAAGSTVTLERTTPLAQGDSFGDLGSFQPQMVGRALDRIYRVAQELRRDVAAASGGAGVQSVNNKTGIVTLTLGDIGAAAEAHGHAITDVLGLQTALDALAPKASPTFTGTVTVPTPLSSDDSTRAATTAWVNAKIAALGAGVALATTGTPADLAASAALGSSTFAARADHVHKRPTLGELGAADVALATVSTADMRTALLDAGALILATGVTVAAAPATDRANKVLAFDAGGDPTFLDPGGVGGGDVSSVNGQTGVVTISTTSLGAVPETRFRTLGHYGTLNGNNIADNKTAIDAMLAASDGEVYVNGKGSETYYTTNTYPDFAHRRMRGPGKFRTADGNNLPADFRYLSTAPAKGTGSGILYDFSGDLRHTDATYMLVATGARRSPDERYYDITATPRWIYQDFRSGGSGSDAMINVGATSAQDTVGVNLSYGGTTELAAGQTAAILASSDGTELYRGVIDTVTAAGAASTVKFTTAFGVTIPAGATLTRSKRTLATNYYGNLIHTGKGDAHVYTAQVEVGGNPGNGVGYIFQNKTGGLFHGDIAISASGVYSTAFETQVQGSTHDFASIGWVHSIVRNVDTAARGEVVGGIRMAAGGSKPSDFAYQAVGTWRSGIDFTFADFSSNDNAAIQLGEGQRIYLNGRTIGTGRASDPTGVNSTLWGSDHGNTHFSQRATDGRGVRVEWVVNNNLSAAGYGVINFRGSAVEVHRALNVYDQSGAQAFNLDPATKTLSFVDGNVGVTRIGNSLVLKAGGANRLEMSEAGYVTAGGAINSGLQFQVAGTQVVGSRKAAVADATGTGDVVVRFNELLNRLRASTGHGLISG